MRLKTIVAAALVMAPLGSAEARTISGELGLYNKYLDDDLFPLTDEPVVQAGIYVDVTEQCSLDAWGSHGVATSEGGELDLGGSCRFAFGEAELELAAARHFLRGVDDITAMSVGVTRGPVNVSVEHYFWDNQPDATRAIGRYTIKASKALIVRPMIVYETGFGEADIFAGGINAELKITKQLALLGTVLAPIVKGSGDTRTTQAQVGVQFSF